MSSYGAATNTASLFIPLRAALAAPVAPLLISLQHDTKGVFSIAAHSEKTSHPPIVLSLLLSPPSQRPHRPISSVIEMSALNCPRGADSGFRAVDNYDQTSLLILAATSQ